MRGEFRVAADGEEVELQVLKGRAKHARTVAERVFALDWSIQTFHEALRGNEQYQWIVDGRHGRFLRSASLYEDVFKIILTTNTVWSRTKFMNDRATELWGNRVDSLKAFPRPEAILHAGESALRAELGCGYRAPFLLGLAERAASERDLFFGDGPSMHSPDQFCRLLRSIRGVGEVSAHYVARMYGFNLGFAVDSYVLRRCQELWEVPATKVPGFLRRRYATSRSLAAQLLWLEITRAWHLEKRIGF
jgi:3-methyladenine DNA glycosylase/8-oxoguanine DNA glycosylase